MADTTITENYVIANFSTLKSERKITVPGTDAVSGVKSSGTVLVSVTGSSFDSADYPRITIADGSVTSTFVFDNDARGLKMNDGTDAYNWDHNVDFPFEDSQVGRMVVPTKDNYQSASVAMLSFHPSDYSAWSQHVHNLSKSVVSASNGSGLTAITARPHFVVRDGADKTIKIGIGPSGSFIAAGGGTLTTNGTFGLSAPSFRVWREGSTSNYYISFDCSSGGNQWRTYNPWIHVINTAKRDNNINLDAFGALQSSHVLPDTQVTQGGNWTHQMPYAVIYRSRLSGAVGNTSYMQFVDPTNYFSSSAQHRMVSWGYDEHINGGILQAGPSARHAGYSEWTPAHQTGSQFFGEHKNTKIYFRQGAPSGSTANTVADGIQPAAGSGAALSTINIAEALKDMINASELNITASRSSSTVNLSLGATGSAGNVTITATSGSGKLSVSGMTGGTNYTAGAPATEAEVDIIPYRLSYKGPQNIRGQTTTSRFRTFLGEGKT